MPYEYKVIPAPAKGTKAPGVKGAEARFAHSLEHAINDLASHGWEYLRSDILPSEERQGLRGSQTVYRSVLVFRRALSEGAQPTPAPEDNAAPIPPVGPATVAPEEDPLAPPVFAPLRRGDRPNPASESDPPVEDGETPHDDDPLDRQ